MNPKIFFTKFKKTAQKQYEALRALYLEERPATEVANAFGYTLSSLYSLARDFREQLQSDRAYHNFFIEEKPGRKKGSSNDANIISAIIKLRKNYLSVDDIKAQLDASGRNVSTKFIYNVIKKEGFGRLPKRSKSTREETSTLSIKELRAMKSELLEPSNEEFHSSKCGVLCFLI